MSLHLTLSQLTSFCLN